MDNIRWRIVGVMFLPSIFENRCGNFRRSMYRLSKIDDRCHDVSTFEDRCVDLRRSLCHRYYCKTLNISVPLMLAKLAERYIR